MLEGEEDYCKILETEMRRRQARNPSYSLRAFARDLRLSPATVSDVLGRKQGLSLERAHAIAERLAFNGAETEYFCSLVEAKHSRSKAARERAAARVARALDEHRQFAQIKHDAFKMIAEWHHLALLDLFHLADFRPDPAWMAGRLGIGADEAEAAVACLTRLGLVRRDGDGLTKVFDNVTVPGGIASDAVKRFHRGVLAKAEHALTSQALAERDFAGLVIPVKRGMVEAARQRLKDFRREFDREFKCVDGADEIYVLASQLFRLSEPAGISVEAEARSSRTAPADPPALS